MVLRGGFDFLVLVVLMCCVDSKEVIWRFNGDISIPDNWVGGILAADCKGVHFAAVNGAPVYIDRLEAAELTLPSDGEVDFSNDVVIDFKDNKKCINLKPFNYHRWYDPDSWRLPDNNAAVPDKEKIPCQHDDVTLPLQEHSLMDTYSLTKATVNSIKIKDATVKSTVLGYFHGDDKIYIDTSTEQCSDPYGCLCHNQPIFCPLPQTKEKLQCLNPVLPENFCREICGAYLTYNIGEGPDLQQVRTKLKKYEVDTHVSRVKNYLGKEVVQVVFSEKEYSGRSLEDAEDFLQYLKSSEAKNVQAFKSGQFYVESGSTFWLIFLSLVVVLGLFGLVFYIYGDWSIIEYVSRINRGRDSIFTVPFFARFDNTDENLIIDGQSESGSILDLPKSFDNPLYEQGPSTTESQHENPLYEVTKDTEAEE